MSSVLKVNNIAIAENSWEEPEIERDFGCTAANFAVRGVLEDGVAGRPIERMPRPQHSSAVDVIDVGNYDSWAYCANAPQSTNYGQNDHL